MDTKAVIRRPGGLEVLPQKAQKLTKKLIPDSFPFFGFLCLLVAMVSPGWLATKRHKSHKKGEIRERRFPWLSVSFVAILAG